MALLFSLAALKHQSLPEYIIHLNKHSNTLQNMIGYSRTLCSELPTELEAQTFIQSMKPTDKGALGKMIEYIFFGQKPNIDSCPDLHDRDIKVTHFKRLKNGNMNAKERLTITNCGSTVNYDTFQEFKENERLQTSKYYPKCQRGLLFVMEHTKGMNKSWEELLSQRVLCICMYDMEEFHQEWIDQITVDYSNIRERTLTQTVSQRGQKYLHIHPHGSKGSGTRALGFKNNFVTMIVAQQLAKDRGLTSVNDVLIRKGNSVSIQFI